MTLPPEALRLAEIERELTAGKTTPHAALAEAFRIGTKVGTDTAIEWFAKQRATEKP